ncbi:hypothetical protein EUX98_g8946 [Antrodiella citrinella]|uniref:Uncharacterized protein n=1 Tax=Antrodiella citrinella TaxID=2447956 RepID=A0A4S4M0Y7_9APHY|nr:hypothetical protein EUX98_g8946 [Antrodiella citrinella]
MLIMAMTAIHAILMCWTSGAYVPVTFNLDTGVALYQDTATFVEGVLDRAGRARAHRLMVNMLDLVRNTPHVDAVDNVVDIDQVDFANMPI